MLSWLSGILQGVFGTLLYELLLAGGVGVVIGILKKKREKWSGPVVYGLIGFTLVLIWGFAFTGRGILSPPVSGASDLTVDNSEVKIKDWISSFGYSWQEIPDNYSYFSLRTTLFDGKTFVISRRKEKENFILIYGTYSPTSLEAKEYAKLSPVQERDLTLNLQMAIAGLGLNYMGIGQPLGTYGIQELMPIDHDATPTKLFRDLDAMDLASIIASDTILKCFNDSKVLMN